MKYNIIYRSEKIILKDISKINKADLANILDKFDKIKELWLLSSQVKKLNNYKICDYRFRVWNYRVLFDIDENKREIIVFRILHRSKLY